MDVVKLGGVGQVGGEHGQEPSQEDQAPDAEHEAPIDEPSQHASFLGPSRERF